MVSPKKKAPSSSKKESSIPKKASSSSKKNAPPTSNPARRSKIKRKPRPPKVEFEAVIGKGTLWKSITELMTNDRITIHLTKDGLTIGHENKPLVSTKAEVCIIVHCSSINFEKFICSKPLSVSFDTAEHNSFIKSSKKKAKLTITITSPEDSVRITGQRIYDLTFTIVSPPTGEGVFPDSSCTIMCHEEEPMVWEAPPPYVYRMPVILNSTSFSQIKTFSNQETKRIRIRTQSAPASYVGFFVDSGSTKKINKQYGKPDENVPNFYEDEEGWMICGECDSYISECTCECELCTYPRDECDCVCPCGSTSYLKECECRAYPYQVVERKYPLGALLKLTKLSGMQLRFYEPKDPEPPLKIAFTAAYGSTILGDVEILINDIEEIIKDDPSAKKSFA